MLAEGGCKEHLTPRPEERPVHNPVTSHLIMRRGINCARTPAAILVSRVLPEKLLWTFHDDDDGDDDDRGESRHM